MKNLLNAVKIGLKQLIGSACSFLLLVVGSLAVLFEVTASMTSMLGLILGVFCGFVCAFYYFGFAVLINTEIRKWSHPQPVRKTRKTRSSKMTEDQIYQEAVIAAVAATHDMVNRNPDTWYPCGFAWVNIKPARGKFVSYLKTHHLGSTDSYAGGYTIWNPSKHPTQWMDAKMAGARAFAAVLRKYDIKATAYERMD